MGAINHQKWVIHFFWMIFPFECLAWEILCRTPRMAVAFGEPQVSLGGMHHVNHVMVPVGVQLGG